MNELRKEYHNKTAGQIGEKARDLQTSYFTDEYVFWLEDKLKQLRIGGVVSSSDLIVVELSDEEIKIITRQELEQWQQSAMEFDGFEGWIVRGRLVK